MFPEPSIQTIGAELVRAAGELEQSPAEMLTELFPYIYEASRRMSTRAIGRWLEESHGIKMSQTTISRALRNPEKFWTPFAESIEPYARKVEQAVEVSLSDLMTSQRVFEWAVERIIPCGETEDEIRASDDEIRGAVHHLRRHWFCLSETTRAHMHQYFRDADAAESEEEKK
jgi:hypothetical protein